MTNYEILLDELRDLGMDYRWSKMFVKKLKDDEIAFPVLDEKKKEWALRHGFFPGRVDLYGLDETNYGDYIPDFQYFMLHPMNHHFRVWLGDKLTCKYVLNSNGCESTMPDYYVYVENDGSFTYLMNCPDEKDIPRDENFFKNLLYHFGSLALKPNSGTSGGLGFIKLEVKQDGLFENNKMIEGERLNEIRDSLRNYIITEYVHQHSELSKIWPDSECTLRVIMCKNPSTNKYANPVWTNVISYARFGTSVNGGASNLSSGGVGVGFSFETGEFKNYAIRYKKFMPNGEWLLKQHPDTCFKWEGATLPNWQIVRERIAKICEQISSLEYLGFDIIITENGMKLCEINTHPAMDYEQVMCGPALQRAGCYFEKKGLYSHSGELFYKAYMKSQKND